MKINSARDSYIAGIDPAFAPAVLLLDGAIMAACPGLDTRISYRMLTYALNGDFRHWLCAIDAHKKPFHLRFLYGVLLEDPRGLLRAGTSHLCNLDFASVEEIDARLVTDYVKDAVSRHDEGKARFGDS